ncbi:hypothetical protein SLEP1_g15382 [Rubroshorea leprosula]|uniref:DUF599 domain-containing protein n=1 Tax=Rubroshorea leprosula TaxID=152421 RepID=A0AAV5IM62_9ROSI|nr:hypothetical protein SLEP1_g15382 [Rubroshorea leprosula]
MEAILYLDSFLISLSLFFTLGYHAYLWHNIKNKPSTTSIGLDALRRKSWFQDMKEGDHKKGLLAIQSLRNTLIGTIFSASVAILFNLALAALTNNAYNASHFFRSEILGSMALGYLIDANFLINVDESCEFPSLEYPEMIFERGHLLALMGNRVLCITFPFLLWMFGPLPVAIASVALVWGLYELDFVGKRKQRKKSSL